VRRTTPRDIYEPLASTRPLIIAHRAGNDPALARLAWEAGADVIEMDVWLYRGHLEVRHTRTMRALPLLWDRWSLAPGWGPRLLLDDVLNATPLGAGLLLDLKGNDPRLPGEILQALGAHPRPGHIAVCSQNWTHIDAFSDSPDVRAIHSVGKRHRLRPLLAHLGGRNERAPAGISIHKRLLNAGVVRELRAVATPVMTWPVNDRAEAATLVAWGVDGVISDDLELIGQIASARRDARYTSIQ
jgi:glycerophosphoryl diester phosphodiesterase